ncbi:MAG: IS91 family transposase [Planctomycetota bacterium]
MGCTAARLAPVYRPRQPRASPLWQLLDRYFDEFQRVYDDRYQKRYGYWRPVIAASVRRFLACGDLREGFARVRCPRCRHEFFVAFSCRRRCLCPSCHQKRALVMAEHVAREVCQAVPHRQFVFTIPKRLRLFFRFDRRLLGRLPRLAWQAVRDVYGAVLDNPDVVPGMVAAIHTFGELVHWHPHVHALVTDGAFAPNGTFLPLPPLDTEPFQKRWQRLVFDLLLAHGKIDEDLVRQMIAWRHSGFSVHHGVRLDAGDTTGLQRLGQYLLRCPFSLQRLIKVTDQGQVLYLAEKRACRRFPTPASPHLFNGVSRNFQVFDPLDFIAEVTQHVPQPRKHLVRYFGFYSNKSRGRRAQADRNHVVEIHDDHTPRPVARRRWAALIKRIWQVDPLTCPRCGGRMKIVSFISPAQRDVIDRILDHGGRASRNPPAAARAPPAPAPAIRTLTYVSDVEFVQDPGPAEPVWAAE